MEAVQVGRGRLVAFRIIAVLFGIVGVAFTLPFVVLTWFDDGKDSIHHIHLVSGLASGLLFGVGLLWVAWRPLQTIALFRAIFVFGVAGGVAGLIAADLFGSGGLIGLVLVVAVAALHPARTEVFRLGSLDLKRAVVPFLALVVGFGYVLGQARLQRDGIAGDPHVDAHHYAGMAWVMLGLPLAALAAAFGGGERRFVSRAVGITYAALGAASLRFPDFASAFDAGWAWAAIATGVAIAALGELPDREWVA